MGTVPEKAIYTAIIWDCRPKKVKYQWNQHLEDFVSYFENVLSKKIVNHVMYFFEIDTTLIQMPSLAQAFFRKISRRDHPSVTFPDV